MNGGSHNSGDGDVQGLGIGFDSQNRNGNFGGGGAMLCSFVRAALDSPAQAAQVVCETI